MERGDAVTAGDGGRRWREEQDAGDDVAPPKAGNGGRAVGEAVEEQDTSSSGVNDCPLPQTSTASDLSGSPLISTDIVSVGLTPAAFAFSPKPRVSLGPCPKVLLVVSSICSSAAS